MNEDFLITLCHYKIIIVFALFGVISFVHYILRFFKFLFSKKLKEFYDAFQINLKIYFLRVLIFRKVVWYILLLLLSGGYSFINWETASKFSPFTGDALIFFIFSILAISPLFKKVGLKDGIVEMDLGIMQIEKQQESLQKLLEEKDDKKERKNTVSRKMSNDIIILEKQVKELKKEGGKYHV